MYTTRCLERARDGDEQATRVLVESLWPRLARMASYYGRRTGEDPDDLLQEAWLGLLEALPELDMRIGTPEQYLIQCARWRLLDSVKRARVRRCLPLDNGPETLSESSDDHAVARACASEFLRELESTQRIVLDCLLDGLTWRETGQVLGCTSANVAYYVRQIRKRYEEWSTTVSL